MKKLQLSANDSSISFVLSYIVSQLLITLLVMIFGFYFSSTGKTTDAVTQFFNTSYGYLILTATLNLSFVLIFAFVKSKREIKLTNKIKFKKLFIYILIGIISYVLLYPIINLISYKVQQCGIVSPKLPYTVTTKNYFISLISLVLLPAVCEELIFRGIIFTGLKKYGKCFSIIVSALMFAIFHMSIEQIVYPILMGVLFAVIMYYENNILYCIAIHILNNFITLTLAYFNFSFINTSTLYIAFAILFALTFIVALAFFLIKKDTNKEKIKLNINEKFYLLASFVIMIAFYLITTLSN